MIYYDFLWINEIPIDSGVSSNIYPCTIIMGTTIDFKKHFRIYLSAYSKTNKSPKPTNSIQPRTNNIVSASDLLETPRDHIGS